MNRKSITHVLTSSSLLVALGALGASCVDELPPVDDVADDEPGAARRGPEP